MIMISLFLFYFIIVFFLIILGFMVVFIKLKVNQYMDDESKYMDNKMNYDSIFIEFKLNIR